MSYVQSRYEALRVLFRPGLPDLGGGQYDNVSDITFVAFETCTFRLIGGPRCVLWCLTCLVD